MSIHFAGLCFTHAAGIPFSHNRNLVVLSYVIAAIGAYAALDMAERLRAAPAGRARFWLCGSAVTLGGSIWAMHFIGLLAVKAAFPIGYDPLLTVLSLVLAVAIVALGLVIARCIKFGPWNFVVAGAIVGLGVAAMHYVGMAALVLPGTIAYRPTFWGLSVLIAIAAAIVALWLSMTPSAVWQRGLAALVMAAAICGMHYVGMWGTEFLIDFRVPTTPGVATAPLAMAVGGTSLSLLLLATVLVASDRKLLAAARWQAETLRRANIELMATQRQIIRHLCLAGECRDSDTGEHVDRIGLMAQRLAVKAGGDASFAEAVLMAAPLHDIGKIGIPDSILLKVGPLTPGERAEMQKHVEIGHRILSGSNVGLLDFAAEIALSHHERWDGTGYPHRLAGEAIPLGARIVAVVDCVDALLSWRPYKKPWPIDQVGEYLTANSGRQFDPRLVEVFLADLPEMLALRELPASHPEHTAPFFLTYRSAALPASIEPAMDLITLPFKMAPRLQCVACGA